MPSDKQVIDSTKFYWEYRLVGGGQVFEYKKTEITSEAARELFRLASVMKNIMHPRCISDIRKDNSVPGKVPKPYNGKKRGRKPKNQVNLEENNQDSED
jgi:hypothetical protein